PCHHEIEVEQSPERMDETISHTNKHLLERVQELERDIHVLLQRLETESRRAKEVEQNCTRQIALLKFKASNDVMEETLKTMRIKRELEEVKNATFHCRTRENLAAYDNSSVREYIM